MLNVKDNMSTLSEPSIQRHITSLALVLFAFNVVFEPSIQQTNNEYPLNVEITRTLLKLPNNEVEVCDRLVDVIREQESAHNLTR